MKRLLKVVIVVAVAVAVYVFYAEARKVDESSENLGNLTAQKSAGLLTGKVVETMDSGGYTYMKLDQGDKKIWVATSKIEVKEGQEISLYPGATMKNYESKTLNRTFETIVFSSGPVRQKSPVAGKDPHGGAMKPASFSGKVVETMNSSGYTYINLEKDDKQAWVAVPEMEVEVGQEISLYPRAAMKNHQSKTLNRTFETIIFSPGPVEESGPLAGTDPHGGKKDFTSEVKEKIEKASGTNGYTVAELYDKKSSLDKKSVVVRAKVVKVSPDIMQKNWIHIQDGSGDPGRGSHDIIALSTDLPSVGDVVTVSGTLVNDKDIGGGYRFDVIIEEAKISE
jgi:hypothetical protein